jgi:hypothetical protein
MTLVRPSSLMLFHIVQEPWFSLPIYCYRSIVPSRVLGGLPWAGSTFVRPFMTHVATNNPAPILEIHHRILSEGMALSLHQ